MTVFPPITDALVSRYDAPGPRYTSYPTVPNWTVDVGPEIYALKLAEAAAIRPDEPLSLYFHLPFCRKLCSYCGCNVVITRERSKVDRYLDHVAIELELAAEALGTRRSASQIHWGGGTPTFLDEDQIQRLWRDLSSRFSPQPGAEIAIEIDPSATSHAQIRLLRKLGFNRLSMGVQDFDPAVQLAVNRKQTFEDTKAMFDLAREVGFSSVNADLIYGLPSQTPDGWRRTLEKVLELRPERLAVYSFAYLPDLRKQQRKLRPDTLPLGASKLGLFAIAYEAFLEAGYEPIGMDHFALPTEDLAVARRSHTLGRNFQGYTVRSAPDSVGFGVTAISDVAGTLAQNVRGLTEYYGRVSAGQLATERGIVRSGDDLLRRDVINEIMCNFRVDLGPGGRARFAPEIDALRKLEHDGLVQISGSSVDLTPSGRIFVRNIAMVFDPYLRGEDRPVAFSKTV